MWKFLVSRTIQIVVTLFVFFALTYFILDAQPGDITMQYTNPRWTLAQRQELAVRLGLDRPWYERFFKWVGNTLQGDLGLSYADRRPVMEIILERAPRTIFLFLTALIIEFIVGYFLGRVLAWSRGSVTEYGITVVGAIMYTIFTPWFALLMIYFFGFTLGWFPLRGFLEPTIWLNHPEADANTIFGLLLLSFTVLAVLVAVIMYATRKMNPGRASRLRIELTIVAFAAVFGLWLTYQYDFLAVDIIKHTILPVATLTIINFSGTMLLTRTTMLETLREDYIMAARAKGLTERVVRDKHAARNALLPVFTGLILSLPFVLAGGIITETIFSWPGMGRELLQASTAGDIPVVMGAFLFIGTLSLVAHFIADITYAFLDPRIRYS